MEGWKILGGASILAVLIRLIAGWSLVSGPSPLPFPDDAPYHWVRMEQLRDQALDVRALDPGSGFPEGLRAHWPWGFDLGMVTLARVLGAVENAQELRRLTALVIPVLGALLIPLVWLLGSRLGSPRAASLAALLTAVMPFHVQYSMAGRVDHHVLEPLFFGFGVLGLMAESSGPVILLSGLVLGLSFSMIPSALFPVLTLMTVGGMQRSLQAPRSAVSWGLAVLAGTAASLPLSPHASEWAFFSPSRTHLMLVGLATLAIGGTAAARRPGSSGARALALGAVPAAAGAVVLHGFFPEGLRSLWEGLAYLAGGGMNRLSFEARPLLSEPLRAWTMLGVASPLGCVGLWRLLSGGDAPAETRETRRLIGWLAVAMVGGAMLQRRFVMVAVPLLVLLIGEGLWWTGDRIRLWLDRRRVRGPLARALLWAILAGVLLQDGGQPLAQAPWRPLDQAFLEAGHVVAERYRSVRPAEPLGVLAPWGHGHLVRWASGLPVICDNFFGAPDHDRGIRRCFEFLLETDPDAFQQRLRDLRVGFALLQPPHPEEVRRMSSLCGLPEETFVDDQVRFTPAFARTSWLRLGLFAQKASPGDRGPLGAVLTAHLRVRDRASGDVQAEVSVLEFLHDRDP